jgi:hypothetical protein
MANWLNCFQCAKVYPLFGLAEERNPESCPTCGSTNVEILSQEQFDKGTKKGAIYNIDPKTGKRAKKPPRRI